MDAARVFDWWPAQSAQTIKRAGLDLHETYFDRRPLVAEVVNCDGFPTDVDLGLLADDLKSQNEGEGLFTVYAHEAVEVQRARLTERLNAAAKAVAGRMQELSYSSFR